MKKAGVSVHFHTIHGAGHGNGFAGKNIDDLVAAFFEKNLKTKAPAQGPPEALTTESTASAVGPDRSQAPGAPGQPGGNGAQRPGANWERMARDDANSDGKVTREEFKGPPRLFDLLDKNHDSVLTKEDFADAPAVPAPPAGSK